MINNSARTAAWMPTAAFVISLLAIIMTIISFCYQNRSGNLVVGTNKVFVSVLGGPHILVPISFANDGGRSLEVNDVLLLEEFDGKTTSYNAWFTIKPDRVESFLNGSWFGKTDALPELSSYFVPFSVSAGSQDIQYVVFNLFSGTALFVPGRHVKYTLVAWNSGTQSESRASSEVDWPTVTMEHALKTGGASGQVATNVIKWREAVAGATPNP